MSGPAYVRSLGALFVPTCDHHAVRWSGPASSDESTARLNASVHNTDRHADDQAGLFDLDTQETR